ncbi:MAG: hypothetical protein AB1505_19975 [Candidatus Latescibacterota bacterium]
MTEAMRTYRALELRLWYTRWRYEGRESPEEDAILDEMEQAWLQLSDDEHALLWAEGPRCWPMDAPYWPPALPEARSWAPKPWTYDGFRSPEQAIVDADAA